MEVTPPEELVFPKGSIASNPKQILTIKNTTGDSHVAFKVKTTAPKQFCVRPNAGKLAPGEKCEIQVILQLREGATLDVKRKDKFLVQGIRLPPSLIAESNPSQIAECWAQSEQARKLNPGDSDVVLEKKLRCVYVDDTNTLQIPEKPRSATPGDRTSIYNFEETDNAPPVPNGIMN
jgi:hypothetical protein